MSGRFGLVIAAWGLALTVLALVALLGFESDVDTRALLGGAAALALLGGLAVLVFGVERTPAPVELLSSLSPATAWTAVAVATLALGVVLGPWLMWIGGGMTLIGAGAVFRELRAERRTRRDAAEAGQ